jgi:hypothetical protein
MPEQHFDPMETAPAVLKKVYGDLELLHERLKLRRIRFRSLADALRSISSSGVRDSIVGMVETMIKEIDKDLAFMREVQEDIKSRGLPPEDDSFGH